MHFFLEHTLLDAETSPYGPVAGSPTTKYNVTSQFSLTGQAKAFACQESRMLVLPSTDPNLVNVILKPLSKLRINAPKIQYYVYRGLLKSSFFTGDAITPPGAGVTTFIEGDWVKVDFFNSKSGLVKVAPSPAVFGYLDLPEGVDVEELFSIITTVKVDEGMWFGNFNNTCGFEIITETENQKIDLQYLKKSSHQIDVSMLNNPGDEFAAKKEKEKILNYLDPAALWGMYFEKGISVSGSAAPLKKASLYNAIISKYSSRNKIYLDIRGKGGCSYNFDANGGQISFDLQGTNPSVFVNYETEPNGFPIIIKEIAPSASQIKELQFSFNYEIDNNIAEDDINITAYCIFPGDKRERFVSSANLVKKNAAVPPVIIRNGESNLIKNIPVNSIALPANFSPVAAHYKIEILRKQTQPLLNYYEDLWKIDRIDSVVSQNLAGGNYAYWKVSSKPRLVNLIGLDLKDTVITNKVFFDNVKKNGAAKTRRLYGAIITDTSEKNKNLIIRNLTSGWETNVKKGNYGAVLYNSSDYQVYKGEIIDAGVTKKALSFVNGRDFELKQSYVQLGITDEEYNRLLYDDIAVPNPLPAVTHIPQNASELFLHLKEVTIGDFSPTSGAAMKIFRKFYLGVKYKNNTGAPKTTYPTTDIFVYTIDGIYFFTQEYAYYQEFYEEFAKATVFFRTLPAPAYNGEFGFDWLREGDVGEDKYEDYIKDGYERYSDPPDPNIHYESKHEAFKFLRNEYQNIPKNASASPHPIKEQLYFTPYLNIYSQPASARFSIEPPPHTVDLRVLVEIEEDVDRLVFEYDKTIFSLDKDALPPLKVDVNDAVVKITISCKKDFKENKYIKVFAKKGADKKLAGQIIVCKNSLINRNELKFVLVKVLTDIDNDNNYNIGHFNYNIGHFGLTEIKNLRNSLHQSLINGYIVHGPDLDLRTDPDYQMGNGPDYGKFIYKNTGFPDKDLDGKLWHQKDYPLRPMFIDIHDKFIALHPTFSSYFTIFSFNEMTSKGTTFGSNQGPPFIYNVLLFAPEPITPANPTGRDKTTMNHESYHGLGLQHTHEDDVFEPERKYIYPQAHATGATDNVMSYDSNAITLWFWQWKIVKAKLK
jgi:hypothetical protein